MKLTKQRGKLYWKTIGRPLLLPANGTARSLFYPYSKNGIFHRKTKTEIAVLNYYLKDSKINVQANSGHLAGLKLAVL
jgi:hypothetical protein